jgi:uncharacterized coiled-coil protein SlyX
MSRDDLAALRDELADLASVVIRLEATVELLRVHLVRITERLSGLEVGSLTPPPTRTP